MVNRRPWLAVMDLSVTRNSPAGSCVRAEVEGLADEYDVVVFSDAFDNPRPERIAWVRVPLPQKPGLLRYVFFHLLAPYALRREQQRRGRPASLIQATQGQYLGANISYAHFCHRAYLEERWSQQDARGVRRLLRWLSYRYNAWSEARAFARVSAVVTPSRGLARELTSVYPNLAGRVVVNPNPVDSGHFARSAGFDRQAKRVELGLPAGATILAFAALGDFARKGLGLVLAAMAELEDATVCLLVIGGQPGEIARYQKEAETLGLSGRVRFCGFQKDIRPYLWAADLFVFPSSYETFALVVLQAMAAGLPAIVTALHGVEDYAMDGVNARVVERNRVALGTVLAEVLADENWRKAAADAAGQTASDFGVGPFVARWRSLYAGWLA